MFISSNDTDSKAGIYRYLVREVNDVPASA
jgi:hypothetical protein